MLRVCHDFTLETILPVVSELCRFCCRTLRHCPSDVSTSFHVKLNVLSVAVPSSTRSPLDGVQALGGHRSPLTWGSEGDVVLLYDEYVFNS